jgi:hypothetical protein
MAVIYKLPVRTISNFQELRSQIIYIMDSIYRLLSLDISKKVHDFYGDTHNEIVLGLTMLSVEDFVSCN